MILHPLKAALELTVSFLQRRLGIKRKIARDVYQHEKEIAQFAFQSSAQVFVDLRAASSGNTSSRRLRPGRREFFELLLQFFGFLAEFFEESLNIRPIETHAGRARAELV